MSPASAPRADRSSAPGSTSSEAGADERRPLGASAEELDVLRRVAELLRSIRHGNVVIVVQDGKVVQIETSEKFRLR
jgi:hypothetical protein